LLLAGEGSLKERGRSPLSKISPPLKHYSNGAPKTNLFERGTKGVSIVGAAKANKTLFNPILTGQQRSVTMWRILAEITYRR
jgi:hypothetical protein